MILFINTCTAEATSDKLLEAEIDIYNETECRRLMFSTTSPKTPLGHQPDLMICAGVPDGSKDACTVSINSKQLPDFFLSQSQTNRTSEVKSKLIHLIYYRVILVAR